jgi:hypothetical protein
MTRNHRSWIFSFAAIVAALGLFGCTSSEGERCTAGSGTDECASGLVCTVPTNCSVGYCCPSSGKSTNPGCAACAAPPPSDDAGDGSIESDATDSVADVPVETATDSATDTATDSSVTDTNDGAVDSVADTKPEVAIDSAGDAVPDGDTD